MVKRNAKLITNNDKLEKAKQLKEISKIKDFDSCIEYINNKRESCGAFGSTISNIAVRFNKEVGFIYSKMV